MPVERFFSPNTLITGEQCCLEGQEFYHLSRVVRCREKEVVEVVNGRGQLGVARVERIEKQRALLLITSVREEAAGKTVILAQGIPRLNRLEFILEKGTELGATSFWLFPGEWSEKTEFSQNQKERILAITIGAMKQCGRLDLPPILFKPPLASWGTPEHPLFYGDTDPAAPPLRPPVPSPLILLVGPERGLSPREQDHLKAIGAEGISLNKNTLRTDTAAIAFLSLATAP